MPIYEYYCENCKKEFDKIKSIMSNSKLENCPKCNKLCKKIISRTNFKLEGSGWAKDGYS